MTLRNGIKTKGIALVVTGVILAVIYGHTDRRLLWEYLTHIRPGYLFLALVMFLPQIAAAALRWRILVRGIRSLSFLEATKLFLAGKALNALVPSKLGELSKAYFLSRDEGVGAVEASLAVVFEKILNVTGLCVVLLAGAAFSSSSLATLRIGVWLGGILLAGSLLALFVPASRAGRVLFRIGERFPRVQRWLLYWDRYAGTVRKGRMVWLKLIPLSVLVWLLHVVQLYLVFPMLCHPIPLAPAFAFLPLAVLSGTLPFTIGGIGTRDSAVLLLFSPYADMPFLVGVGLMFSVRHLLDTLIGVPFFYRYAGRTPVPRTAAERVGPKIGERA